MTERLYYHDAALLEFSATIVAHADNDPRQVILDRTAFYPTSGGQPHDLGTLGGIAVLDVTDAGDRIIHHLAEALPVGPVSGVVDAVRRHDHMQQHTAQHLLSALAADRFGWQTVSVHFGADSSTIEVSGGQVSEAALRQLEASANAIVAEARPVTVSFEAAEEAVARGLRAAPSRSGDIRVVTIAGIDRSACGGTHTALTSAIGPIRLLGVEKMRGNTRIAFVAGERTMRRLVRLEQTVAEAAKSLGCADFEVAALLSRRLEELRELRERMAALEEERALADLAQLVDAVPPNAAGTRRVIHQDARADLLRIMAQGAGAMTGVLFAGVSMEGPPTTVALGTSADSGLDAGALLKAFVAAHGGKGGGSPRLAQGSVPLEPGAVLWLVQETFGAS